MYGNISISNIFNIVNLFKGLTNQASSTLNPYLKSWFIFENLNKLKLRLPHECEEDQA